MLIAYPVAGNRSSGDRHLSRVSGTGSVATPLTAERLPPRAPGGLRWPEQQAGATSPQGAMVSCPGCGGADRTARAPSTESTESLLLLGPNPCHVGLFLPAIYLTHLKLFRQRICEDKNGQMTDDPPGSGDLACNGLSQVCNAFDSFHFIFNTHVNFAVPLQCVSGCSNLKNPMF